MMKVGDINGVTADRVLEWWRLCDDGRRRRTGVTVMLRRECWNGGGYMTTVGGGVTGMTCDLQATVVNKQDLADIWFESL